MGTCRHGRGNGGTLPRWAGVWVLVMAAAMVLHAFLPLVHVAASFAPAHARVAAARGGEASPGLGGSDAAHADAVPVHDEDACPTCRELVLVKQIIPWQPPALMPLPGRTPAIPSWIAGSRSLWVSRPEAPVRGPPRRA